MTKKRDTHDEPNRQLDSVQDQTNGTMVEAIVLDDADESVRHADIASIAATELDGITINRTKSRVDPFIDIRKERLVDKLTGAPSRSFAVWVPDPDAPEGWRDMGTVSENYLLLTNKEVRQLALEVAESSGFSFQETRIFWDGARFAHVIDFSEVKDEISKGDTVGLSLITRTSYDRSWKFEAALMGKRFLCDNGVLAGEFFARVSFKHLQDVSDADAWKDIVRQGLSVIEHASDDLERFVEGLRRLKRQKMTDEHMREIWSRLPRLGDSLLGKIMRQYIRDEESTLYGLLNAGTGVFWHNEKLKSADFVNNDMFTSALLDYAFANLN